MAKEEKKETKVALERTYIVPLRTEWLKAPRYRRSKKAVNALMQFIMKHMKSDDVRVGKYLNEEIWKHGIKNPPHKIKVNAKKYDDNSVKVELFGAPEEKPVEAEKKPKKDEKEEKPAEAKTETIKSEKAKEIEKQEIKELKKEHPKVHHAPKQAIKQKAVEQHPTAPMAR